MGKRKITVTVDEELVELAQRLGDRALSQVVNEALGAHVERIGRRLALRHVLDEWEAQLGPVSSGAASDAREAFDELDGTTDRRGAA